MLLRAILAAVALFLVGLLRMARIVAVGVTLGSPLAHRLTLAAVARAFGAATLLRAGLLALRAAGLAAACGGTFGPAALARFGPTALGHSFVVGSAFPTRSATAHPASGMTARRHSLFARRAAGTARATNALR